MDRDTTAEVKAIEAGLDATEDCDHRAPIQDEARNERGDGERVSDQVFGR